MALAAVVEAGVIDQIGATVGCCDDRVVALGQLTLGHIAPVGVGTHQLHTTGIGTLSIVHHILVEDGAAAVGILIGTVGILRTEHAHDVATCGIEEAVANEQIIIVAHVLYVGALARYIVAAGHLFPEIGVAGHAVAAAAGRGIGHVVVAQTSLLVEFEHPDAARPRPVDHPQLALLVVEHSGVDGVWPTASPARAYVVA